MSDSIHCPNFTDQPVGKPDVPTSVTKGPPAASGGSGIVDRNGRPVVSPADTLHDDLASDSRIAAIERRLASLEQWKSEFKPMDVCLDKSPAVTS